MHPIYIAPQPITDHGEADPIPFELGSWSAVAVKAREAIEEQTGRILTDVEVEA